MAQSTQSTSEFAAAQKLRANSTLSGAQQLIADLGLAGEVEVVQEVVQVRINFRQPSGATWDQATFETNLRNLKLIQ